MNPKLLYIEDLVKSHYHEWHHSRMKFYLNGDMVFIIFETNNLPIDDSFYRRITRNRLTDFGLVENKDYKIKILLPKKVERKSKIY